MDLTSLIASACEEMASSNATLDYDTACNMTGYDEAGGMEYLTGFDPLRRKGFAAIVIACYAIVLTIGLLGNVLVFVTVVKTPRMRTATNIFIANLALADIFVCAFDLPITLHYQLSENWVFGTALCHVFMTLFGVIVYVSTLSLTVIAADRFALIVLGIRRRMSACVALGLVLIIAVVSTGAAMPMAVYSQLMTVTGPHGLNRIYCREKWPSLRVRKVYTVLTLLLQYFLPLGVIAVLYFLVFRHVRASQLAAGSKRRASKTNLMLAAVVLVFTVAWTPYQLFSVICEFNSNLVSGPYFKFSDMMLRLIAMGSSGINPFLYGWMNDNFRRAFSSMVRVPGVRGQTRATAETETTMELPRQQTAARKAARHHSPPAEMEQSVIELN